MTKKFTQVYLYGIITLTLIIFLVILPCQTTYASAATNNFWDGSSSTAWYDGVGHHEGSEADPYQINSESDLAGLAQLVNAGNEFQHNNFVLTRDLNLRNSSNSLQQWIPIGNENNEFFGTFDGCNHHISGLYIDTSESCQGLFGCVFTAEVRNITIDGYVSAGEKAGGLVGSLLFSIMDNCHNEASVSAEAIAGGLAGNCIQATIINCSNQNISTSPAIMNTEWDPGTIIVYDKTSNTYGTSVGGIVGVAADSDIYNCWNTGLISGETNVGGICGLLLGANKQNTIAPRIINCWNSGTIDKQAKKSHWGCIVGGAGPDMKGQIPYFMVINCYGTSSNIVSDSSYIHTSNTVANNAVFDPVTWRITDSQNHINLPILPIDTITWFNKELTDNHKIAYSNGCLLSTVLNSFSGIISGEYDYTKWMSDASGKPIPYIDSTTDGNQINVYEQFPVRYELNGRKIICKTEKQGPLCEAAFKAATPEDYNEVCSFDILTLKDNNWTVDYTLKRGILSILIPTELQVDKRTFVILGIDESGQTKLFADMDASLATITIDLDISGYAFLLIYK